MGEQCCDSNCSVILNDKNAVCELVRVFDSPTGWEALGDYCIECAKKRGFILKAERD
jgi:hypothetical protein